MISHKNRGYSNLYYSSLSRASRLHRQIARRIKSLNLFKKFNGRLIAPLFSVLFLLSISIFSFHLVRAADTVNLTVDGKSGNLTLPAGGKNVAIKWAGPGVDVCVLKANGTVIYSSGNSGTLNNYPITFSQVITAECGKTTGLATASVNVIVGTAISIDTKTQADLWADYNGVTNLFKGTTGGSLNAISGKDVTFHFDCKQGVKWLLSGKDTFSGDGVKGDKTITVSGAGVEAISCYDSSNRLLSSDYISLQLIVPPAGVDPNKPPANTPITYPNITLELKQADGAYASKPINAVAGDKLSAKWSSTNAQYCDIQYDTAGNNIPKTKVKTSGTKDFTASTKTTDFIIDCYGTGTSGGRTRAALTINASVTTNLTADKTTVAKGESVKLTWSSAGAKQCRLGRWTEFNSSPPTHQFEYIAFPSSSSTTNGSGDQKIDYSKDFLWQEFTLECWNGNTNTPSATQNKSNGVRVTIAASGKSDAPSKLIVNVEISQETGIQAGYFILMDAKKADRFKNIHGGWLGLSTYSGGIQESTEFVFINNIIEKKGVKDFQVLFVTVDNKVIGKSDVANFTSPYGEIIERTIKINDKSEKVNQFEVTFTVEGRSFVTGRKIKLDSNKVTIEIEGPNKTKIIKKPGEKVILNRSDYPNKNISQAGLEVQVNYVGDGFEGTYLTIMPGLESKVKVVLDGKLSAECEKYQGKYDGEIWFCGSNAKKASKSSEYTDLWPAMVGNITNWSNMYNIPLPRIILRDMPWKIYFSPNPLVLVGVQKYGGVYDSMREALVLDTSILNPLNYPVRGLDNPTHDRIIAQQKSLFLNITTHEYGHFKDGSVEGLGSIVRLNAYKQINADNQYRNRMYELTDSTEYGNFGARRYNKTDEFELYAEFFVVIQKYESEFDRRLENISGLSAEKKIKFVSLMKELKAHVKAGKP